MLDEWPHDRDGMLDEWPHDRDCKQDSLKDDALLYKSHKVMLHFLNNAQACLYLQ